jgi:fatty acid synthase subunit alpha, fungi type
LSFIHAMCLPRRHPLCTSRTKYGMESGYLKSYKAMLKMMTTNTLVKIKEAPRYSIELETPVLLNSLARASPDKKTGSYTFKGNQPTEMKRNLANVKAIEETLKFSRSTAGVGVDQGVLPALSSWGLE